MKTAVSHYGPGRKALRPFIAINGINVLLVLSTVLLNGCVSLGPPVTKTITPLGAPEETYIPRGLALETSATVALVVSTQPIEKPGPKSTSKEVHPSVPPDTAIGGFTEGFGNLHPDVAVRLAGEAMSKACFPNIFRPDGALTPTPKLSAADCRVFADRLGVRYLILLGSLHVSSSDTKEFANPMGWAVEVTRDHDFELYVWAFDTRTAEKMCDAVEAASISTSSGAGGVLGWVWLPAYVEEEVDEAAFWKRFAHQAGYKIAGCFLPLEPPKPDTSLIP